MDSQRAKSLLLKYEANLRESEAIPGSIQKIEQQQTEVEPNALSRMSAIEEEAKSDITKLKEAVVAFDGGIEDYRKTQYEIARKSLLETLSSKLARHQADLKKAGNTIAAIKSANSIGQVCAVEGVGRKGVGVEQFISRIRKFLKETKNSSTRTGSDGKFKVPADARYAMAYHYRESTKNELFWLIKIDLEEDQVRLSNSNITNTHERGESDSVWDFLRSDSGKSLLEVMEVSFDDE